MNALNTFSIVLAIIGVALTILYVIREFLPEKAKTLKVNEQEIPLINKQQPNPETDIILRQTGKNEGKRLSQKEIVDNHNYILTNYSI